MTDDSLPLVPSSEASSLPNKKLSSWNFDDLQDEDESKSSNDFFSELKNKLTKHIYMNEDDNNQKCFSNKITDRSTARIDGSALISRCKQFLPLLTDANRTLFSKIECGENVRIELDSDQDSENEGRTIEMNLMFCPNVDSSSDSENTSDESDDDQCEVKRFDQAQKKEKVHIVEIQPLNNDNDHDNNKSQEIIET